MKCLVTGAAGFIGAHTAQRLLDRGDTVVGVDNLNDYYEVSLKEARLARLTQNNAFRFARLDVADRAAMKQLFEREQFDRVAHLAAQAGVRYSLTNPFAYVDSNLVGFATVLEGCRHTNVEHLVYASSSSVYGANEVAPFSVSHGVDHPVSLYAATKKANEMMAHTYSHLFQLPTTGLRFFTVYGPWGRPDMAYFQFARAILAKEKIKVFNHGKMERDFTFIDDIVDGVVAAVDRIATPDPSWSGRAPNPSTSSAPFRVYNLGNAAPVKLMRFIEVLEDCLGRKAVKEFIDMQPGDVLATAADVAESSRDLGFNSTTSIESGLRQFVDWFRGYYR